jgi:hypothetical protein
VDYSNVPTGRAAIERRVVHRAWSDPQFRKRLLDDPRAALGEELGFDVPESLTVSVVEEDPNHLCIVIPVDLSPISWEVATAMTGWDS